MKHPPKKRKTYGKSLKRIAKKLGVEYAPSRRFRPPKMAGLVATKAQVTDFAAALKTTY
jgi:hypothetical protein